MKKLVLLLVFASLFFLFGVTQQADAVFPWQVENGAGTHYEPYCGPNPWPAPGLGPGPTTDPNTFNQFGRCANESYFYAFPIITTPFVGGRWIWPGGHDGDPAVYDGIARPNINSAEAGGDPANPPNLNPSGLVNVIYTDLFGPTALIGLEYITSNGATCGATPHPAFAGGPDISAELWCEEYATTLLGTSYILNTMVGMNATDSSYYGGAAYNNLFATKCPTTLPVPAPNLDVRLNGIAISKCRFAEWRTIVNGYSDEGRIIWNHSEPYPPIGCVPNTGPGYSVPCVEVSYARSDTIVYRDQINASGVANPQTLDVGSYINRNVVLTDVYIRFNNPDGTFFMLNKNCGNITGPANALHLSDGFAIQPIPAVQLSAAGTPADGRPVTEDPNAATFSVTFDVTNPPINNVNVLREYYIDRYSGPDINNFIPADNCTVNFPLPSPLPPCLGNRSSLLPSVTAGDRICTRVTVNPGNGSKDASGNPVGGTTLEESREDCETIVNMPYIRAYGSDIFAGVSSGCSTVGGTGWPETDISNASHPNGGIYGIGRTHRRGSGSQLALLAYGRIDGFRSVVLREDALPALPPLPPSGLNFANTGLSFSALHGAEGGELAGMEHCPHDYFASAPDANTSSDIYFDIPNTSGTYKMTSSPPTNVIYVPSTLGNAAVQPGRNVTLFVDGNVLITKNITYAGGNWITGGTNNVPSFTLVVNGNIYVDRSVTRIDGSLIAQSITAGKGTIYTCSEGIIPTPVVANELFTKCNNQLTINGSLTATRIKFSRTFGSLRNSNTNEQPFGGGSGNNCSNASPGGQSSPGVCGSEVINFTPQVYLAPPSQSSATDQLSSYDYYTTLPPLL